MKSNEDNDIQDEEKKNQLLWKIKKATAIRIVNKAKKYSIIKNKALSLPEEVSFFTGISRADVEKYAMNRLATHFSLWKQTKQLVSTTRSGEVTYEDLKYLLHHNYVTNRIIPTKKTILQGILKMIHKHYDIRMLDNDLKHFGFTWLKLPNTDKCILYEHSSLLFERQHHLKTLLHYRKQGKHIIYLEERICTDLSKYPPDTTTAHNYVIVASTSNGLHQKCYFEVAIIEAFKDFFDTELAWCCPENSVIVTAKKPYLDRTCPDESSTLEQMTEWLEENDYPVSSTSTRAHLYETIKLMLENKPEHTMSQVDTFVLGLGFKIVRYNPLHFHEMYEKCLCFETFQGILFDTIISSKNGGASRNKKYKMKVLIEHVNNELNIQISFLNYWRRMLDQMIIKEQKILQEDMEIEIIVDQLLTMAKYKGIGKKGIEHLHTFEPNAESILDAVIYF